MLKRLSVLVLGLAMISSVVYAAPNRTGRWDAGVSVAGAIPTDSDLDAGVQVGGTIAYGVSEWFAIGFSGGWQSHDSDDASESGITIEGPEVTAVPLFGELIFRVPTGDSPINPYGVVGLGTVLWDADDVSSTALGVPFTAETDIDTEFAVKVGGGFDWFINENWIINFEAAYVFSSPSATVTVSSPGLGSFSESADLDLDYWTVGGGIKVLFG
ncbi:MAG TPA: outer membrane beta-barrel protein [Candidatus Omnitrophota bacterium]|nr:outer membrane beta-barrel protein [Candidatus Omnitrophota bacterium]